MTTPVPYISLNPEIRFGKPCIEGTRIAVSDILQRVVYQNRQSRKFKFNIVNI
jgi:uncharacterized protein (DUF433 family)